MNAFSQPTRRHDPPPWRGRQPDVSTEPPRDDWPPAASPAATFASIFGLVILAIVNSSQSASGLAHNAAIGVAVSIGAGVLIDARRGLKNLIRADMLALATYYYLTLWEFLFPQPLYDGMVGLAATERALYIVYLAFGGLMLGRHLVRLKRQPFESLMTREAPIWRLLALFWIAVALGYFYMLACSGWDVAVMTKAMMDPRFSQPWQRAQLGDWRAAFSELSLLIFLIPALGGAMLARYERYSLFKLVPVAAIVLFTFFYGFASGTRNLFGTYLVNFLVGFGFATPPQKRLRLVLTAGAVAAAMVIATHFMLQFRSMGLTRWLEGEREDYSGELQREYVFVDYNLLNMASVASFFPSQHNYLGIEIPYLAVIRPVPRFLWPGKPVGMSISIEDIMGFHGTVTIAVTFAGEAYISGGFVGVIGIALALGAFAGWWNHFASSRNSEVGILIYATGFLAAVITMRSMFAFTTSLLPVGACIFVAYYALPKAGAGVSKLTRKILHPHPAKPRYATLRPAPKTPAPQRRP